jgi:Spy/CpxP family protein refolding chaperone
MKTSIKIAAVLFAVMISASSCSRHRNIKELREGFEKMHRYGMMQEMRHGNFHRGQWGGNFRHGPEQGFRGQFGPGMMNNGGFGPRMQEMMRMDNIPNLTDKQKKEIADLRDQNMNEMIKFREENMAKMQSMMVEHRKKMMNLLTDEQKKYLDGGREAEPPTEKK